MFELFDLSYDFLDEDVTLWPENQNFLENLEYFKKLQVVNDVAERDDVAVAIVAKHLDDINLVLDINFEKVDRWMKTVNLQLAQHKTAVVLITSRKQAETITLRVGKHEVTLQPFIRYLGVMIDARLNFKQQVEHGCCRAYLHRFKHDDSPECAYCLGLSEDAEYVFFAYPRFSSPRSALETVLYSEKLAEAMLSLKTAWNATSTFARKGLGCLAGGGGCVYLCASYLYRMRTGKRNRHRRPDSPDPNPKSKRDDISINQLT
ncbi:hypothetical protein EVAR_53016_1 [Eumeta japonica]|uniref:Uncharacterized protein n=1 Tax=Eumeta variegata TaxID=151549 RepID=A0A4C1XQJ8_EUMVA|nr:hypothetical protein EVAR_53016_1 [Eumeta japonica]